MSGYRPRHTTNDTTNPGRATPPLPGGPPVRRHSTGVTRKTSGPPPRPPVLGAALGGSGAGAGEVGPKRRVISTGADVAEAEAVGAGTRPLATGTSPGAFHSDDDILGASAHPRGSKSGALWMAAGGLAVLAVVAALLVVSLPRNSHPPASHGQSGAAGGRAAAATHSAGASSSVSTAVHTAALHSAGASSPVSTAVHTAALHSAGVTTAPAGNKAARGAGGTTAAPSTASPPPSTTPTTSAGAASSPAVDLPTPAGFGPLLRRVWVAADPGHSGLSTADVRSTLVGSVYYAEQPAINNYWAISGFVPSAQAQGLASTPTGKATLTQFDYIAIFNEAPGRGWAYMGSFRPGSCPPSVPEPVYTSWGLCQTGS